MGSLCCCWTKKAADKGDAGEAANEMEQIEVPRSADSEEDSRRTVEDSRRTAEDSGGQLEDSGGQPEDSGRQPEDSGGQPEDRGGPPEDSGGQPEDREGQPEDSGGQPENSGGQPEDSGGQPEDSRCAICTWRDMLVENPLADEADDEADASAAESEIEDSAAVFGLGRHNREVATAVLSLINELRISSGVQPLTLCEQLSCIAKEQWMELMNKEDGFAATSCNLAYHKRPVINSDHFIAEPHDCLCYCDILVHSRKHLPAVAFRYWVSNGCRSSIPGKFVPSANFEFPRTGTDAFGYFESSKNQFRPLLLERSNSRFGLFFRRLHFGQRNCPYCVVAIFSD